VPRAARAAADLCAAVPAFVSGNGHAGSGLRHRRAICAARLLWAFALAYHAGLDLFGEYR